MIAVKRFFSQAFLYLKAYSAQFSLLEFVTWDILTTFMTMCFYIIVAAFSFNTQNLTRWLIGNAFLICITQCVFGLSITFTSERYFGRLKSIIVSPTNTLLVVFERAFYPIIWGFVSVGAGFLIGSLIFKVSLSGVNLTAFILTVLTATFAVAGFGLFISVFGLLSDSMQLIHNTATYTLILLSGANFPLTQLPVPIQRLAAIFPLNHSINAANMVFNHEINMDFWRLLFIEVVIGLAYYIITFVIIRFVTKLAIKNATLEMF